MRLLIVLFIMVSSAAVVHAQSSLQDSLSTQKQPSFSGNLAATLNSNLYNPETNSYEASTSADAILNYRVKGANLIRGYFGGTQSFTQGREFTPHDGFVSWVNNSFWSRSSKLTIGQQVRFAAPMSRESRERDSKVTGVSLVPIFIATLTPRFMMIYLPQVNRNFHSFKQNRLQNNNIEYSVGNLLVGIYSLTDNLYWQGVGSYGQAWSYGGTQRDPSFGFSNEIGYSLPKRFTLAFGWSNSGNIRRVEQGQDQSIELFDNRTSTVYSALYWMF